ncbi:HAMP domain-containing sensor histidine kinase [Paenibacillus sp. 3LSP]|jgi:signal transduction histidine kinase|uniref:HAMP domain-containing sensor histidine kinase n=1 Tax=Paenibacillus sp. 3LSP TaxID=2800795 RepID=UPI000542AA69|nr:HAMP domain-containing sensor histidine kinase [Paenibacillus sp. 3LSP]KHF32866.1 Alkaline phosphatase synthesis sensor protein PhoR [Paenibacillus sp. P1XP2]MDU0332024.1 HAMP domain-containing sensor histidine kinase [Paenibacillus sp. 3LSP]
MKRSIVLKLFLLTAGLCLFLIAVIFALQTVFFKQFYAHQKVKDVQSALQAYGQDYAKHAANARQTAKLEQDFYQKYNTWITELDSFGNLQHTDDYFMEIKLDRMDDYPEFSGRTIKVPLYSFINVEDFYSDNQFITPWIKEGEPIAFEGLIIKEQLVIQRMAKYPYNLREEGQLENRQMVNKEYEVVNRYPSPPTQYHETYPSVLFTGMITKVEIPEGAGGSRYTNHLFLERIKAFQADLLYGDYDQTADAKPLLNYEENGVSYKIFIDPLQDEKGKTGYLFAVTSLQPVNEAAGMIRHYYAYIAAGALLLVLLASFYYSRRIARPLLRINRTAQQMAALDFSEKIPVATKDEIGDLSRSINELSEKLHSHIVRLEQDIEKEKQLEHTRKEFISGVSHELKTPLSVIQSCLSVLKDGIASHKRDHYFAAMEDEVNRMNLLIGDMLELAKYESGTYKMEMGPFDIGAAVGRICAKLAPDMEQKGLRLHVSLQPAEVVGNELRIGQVLVNFLTNAIRYTPGEGAVFVAVTEERERVKIGIENKGTHIPEEQLGKIWDRFYRGEPSRQRSTGGTGLGLAISKKILEMHGAPYGVTNTEDGVLFYFYLNKKT